MYILSLRVAIPLRIVQISFKVTDLSVDLSLEPNILKSVFISSYMIFLPLYIKNSFGVFVKIVIQTYVDTFLKTFSDSKSSISRINLFSIKYFRKDNAERLNKYVFGVIATITPLTSFR
jgi:hypothetical protein